jgi:hypothetical protein
MPDVPPVTSATFPENVPLFIELAPYWFCVGLIFQSFVRLLVRLLVELQWPVSWQ